MFTYCSFSVAKIHDDCKRNYYGSNCWLFWRFPYFFLLLNIVVAAIYKKIYSRSYANKYSFIAFWEYSNQYLSTKIKNYFQFSFFLFSIYNTIFEWVTSFYGSYTHCKNYAYKNSTVSWRIIVYFRKKKLIF